MLDEASFNRDAAARYRQGEDLVEAEAELEPAFVNFLRKAGSGNAVRQYSDREFADAVWDLDPSQLQHISASLEPSTRATNGRFRGTFRRAIAQVRHDLDFFTVGHPFFDRVLASALYEPCGRVYAVDVDAQDEPAWAGFEFVLTAGPDLGEARPTEALARRAGSLFVGAAPCLRRWSGPTRPEHGATARHA